MPHFFIASNTVQQSIIRIFEKETYNHIAKSLRSKVGEKLFLIDENEIQYECIISNITPKEIEAEIVKSYKSLRKLDFELYLAQAPLRSDAQSFVIEKATELGAMGIYPIFTDNCALNKEIIKKKIPKWQKIMCEASKQCERANIPTCFELTTIGEVTKNESFDKVLVMLERDADFSLKEYMSKNPILKSEKILVIIGPEGGFSKREFDYFSKENMTSISLGNLILKAETATTVALGNIIHEFRG